MAQHQQFGVLGMPATGTASQEAVNCLAWSLRSVRGLRICWVVQGLSGLRRARCAVMDAVGSDVVSYAAVPGHSPVGRVAVLIAGPRAPTGIGSVAAAARGSRQAAGPAI